MNCDCLDRLRKDKTVSLCANSHLIPCSRPACRNQLDLNDHLCKDGSRRLKLPKKSSDPFNTWFCSHSCSILNAYNDRYCDKCGKVTKHQKDKCVSCAAMKWREKKSWCGECDKNTVHTKDGRCVNCIEKAKFSEQWCDDCNKKTMFDSNGCVSCRKRSIVHDEWCSTCQAYTKRCAADGGKCMKCANNNFSDRYCEKCGSTTSHKGDTCLICTNDKSGYPIEWCWRCMDDTKHSPGHRCLTCSMQYSEYLRYYCDECKRSTLHTKHTNECLSCIRRKSWHKEWCDYCEAETTHSKHGVCRSCANCFLEDEWCEDCGAYTPHNINSGNCVSCRRRKARESVKYVQDDCFQCGRKTTWLSSANHCHCMRCAALKASEKTFKNGRGNRSKVEKFLMESIGAKPARISKINVDGLLELDGNQIVFEYDGSYFHKGDDSEERDLRKTKTLLAGGYHVVRIRENKLPFLSLEDDRLHQIHLDYKVAMTVDGPSILLDFLREEGLTK